MAKRKFDDFSKKDDKDFLVSDVADQAFWDEFWRQENLKGDDCSLVTITVKNQETGEEKVIENVRLRFKSMEVLRG